MLIGDCSNPALISPIRRFALSLISAAARSRSTSSTRRYLCLLANPICGKESLDRFHLHPIQELCASAAEWRIQDIIFDIDEGKGIDAFKLQRRIQL